MSSKQRLARELLDTRRLALGHATTPQLSAASLDGGRLEFKDGEGNPIGGLGPSDNGFGIDYYDGPTPPRTTAPIVTTDAGLMRIVWDGNFADTQDDQGVLPTSDADRVEIHASMDENFVPNPVESYAGAFTTLDGGSFTLGPLETAGTWYVCLVTRSKAGKYSNPSDRVSQELAITSIDLAVTDAWLTGDAAQVTADGKNGIWRGPEKPVADPDVPFKDGDIWFEMTEDGKSIPNIWDEALGEWVGNDDFRQSEIERVQDQLRQDLDTVIIDGSGTKNFYKPVAPKVTDDPAPKEGDLWFDTSEAGANTVHVWTDGSWVSLADARVQEIIAAQEALEADLTDVQTSVDGKNKITYDPALPPASYVGAVGDTWYRTSGNSMIGFWKWDGAAWVQQALSTTVIPQIDIGAGTFGTMSGTRLQAGSVSTSMLAVGVGGNLLPDPKFLDPAMSAIRAGTQWTYKTVSGETCFERVMPNPGSTANLPLTDKLGNEYYLPASPGVKNVLELDVSGPVAMYLYFYMSDGSLSAPGTSIQNNLSDTSRRIARFVLEPDLYATSTAVVERFSVRVRQTSSSTTAPPGTLTRVFSARVSPMSGATVIENGAITTDKIAVGAITAESGIIGSIHAGTITVGEMHGARIKAGTINADTVLVESSIGSTLIKDGAILTEHIKVGAITAESGIIGSIDANVITVGKIMANQLDADAINGKTITGATIRTASSGSRVELTQNGLKQYNSLGAVITDMSLGSFTLNGGTITGSTIKTATSGNRVEITGTGLKQYGNGNEVLVDMTGGQLNLKGNLEQVNSVADMKVGPAFTTGVGPGVAWSNIGSSTDWAGVAPLNTSGPGLVMQMGDSSKASWVWLRNKYAQVKTTNRSGGSWLTMSDDTNWLTWSHPTNSGSSSLTQSDRAFNLSARDSTNALVGGIWVTPADGVTVSGFNRELSLWGSRIWSTTIYNYTSGGSANLAVNSNGTIFRATSSLRYKADVEPSRELASVLDIEPKTWRSKADVERSDEVAELRAKIGEGPVPQDLADGLNGDARYYGAIAEEVHDLGLTELVEYDDFGRPDALNYDKFGVALIPIVRELRDRIEQLETQLAAE